MSKSLEVSTTSRGGGFWGRVRDLFKSKKVENTETVVEFEELVDAGLTDVMVESQEPVKDTESVELGPEALAHIGIGISVDPDEDISEHLEAGFQPDQFQIAYQKQLAELDLEVAGNPNLKVTLQRRIEEWEHGVGIEKLSALSEYMHKSVSEVRELLQQRMEEVVQQSHFFRATETDVFLTHIMSGDRRYKSVIELHHPDSELSYSYRGSVEEDLFGFPNIQSIDGRNARFSRPIYGYFSLDQNGILNEFGTNPPPNVTSEYGRVTVKVKREVVLARATMCLLDSYGSQDTPLSPVALPHYSALLHYWEGSPLILSKVKKFLEHPLNQSTLQTVCGSYTEVQYHGGLTVNDIESVHLSTGNGLDLEQINKVVAAVETYNRETGNNITVVIY